MKFKKALIFMQFAEQLSQLSKCHEGHVAAIIVSADGNQVLSIGINGGAGNLACLCAAGDKYKCIHAEVNALTKCKQDCRGTVLFCTKAPCIQCSALIINAGIKTVIFTDTYKKPQGVQLMLKNGIQVYRMDTATRQLYTVVAGSDDYKEVNINGTDYDYFGDSRM